MEYIAKLYSSQESQISRYLTLYFQTLEIAKTLKDPLLKEWIFRYNNPIELVDLLSFHEDHFDEFQVVLWICLDPDIFIQITEENNDEVIRYLYERFPY